MYTLNWYFKVDTSSKLSQKEKEENNIIIIGAGFSGIGMGCILKMAGMRFIILERAEYLGGTWWYNNYPGAEVDVAGHSYSYSFFNWPNWQFNFPRRDEILGYINEAAKHFGILKFVKYNTTFKDAKWDEENAQWVVSTVPTKETEFNKKSAPQVYKARFLVNCMGFLYKPNYPKIPGIDKFKGRCFHSARWEHDFDYNGKNVAVIGAGATAVQVVPNVAKVAKVTMFQRSKPAPVIPKLGTWKVWGITRFIWRICPPYYYLTQWLFKTYMEVFYFAFDDGTLFAKLTSKFIVWNRDMQLTEAQELKKSFKFPEPVKLCKRIPLYNDFYRKFKDLGCISEVGSLKEINETGILTKDGRQLNFDLIILCTGFDMFHYRDTPIIGRDGYNIRDDWDGDLPFARFGCQVKGYPNYLMLLGPQTGQIHGTGSVNYGECQAQLMWRSIRYTIENGYRSFCLKPEILEKHVEDYEAHTKKNKGWLLKCEETSWYHKNGKIWQPWVWMSHVLVFGCRNSDMNQQYNFKK